MDRDQAFEDDGPCRVVESMLKRSKDFADAGFVRMRGHKDVLDIFGLRWRGLRSSTISATVHTLGRKERRSRDRTSTGPTLILVAPLTDFSKELAMVA
jgi:hypothetical protein